MNYKDTRLDSRRKDLLNLEFKNDDLLDLTENEQKLMDIFVSDPSHFVNSLPGSNDQLIRSFNRAVRKQLDQNSAFFVQMLRTNGIHSVYVALLSSDISIKAKASVINVLYRIIFYSPEMADEMMSIDILDRIKPFLQRPYTVASTSSIYLLYWIILHDKKLLPRVVEMFPVVNLYYFFVSPGSNISISVNQLCRPLLFLLMLYTKETFSREDAELIIIILTNIFISISGEDLVQMAVTCLSNMIDTKSLTNDMFNSLDTLHESLIEHISTESGESAQVVLNLFTKLVSLGWEPSGIPMQTIIDAVMYPNCSVEALAFLNECYCHNYVTEDDFLHALVTSITNSNTKAILRAGSYLSKYVLEMSNSSLDSSGPLFASCLTKIINISIQDEYLQAFHKVLEYASEDSKNSVADILLSFDELEYVDSQIFTKLIKKLTV